MRLMLVGQKWLGERVLGALRGAGHEVAFVAAPAGDRLALAAADAGIYTGDPGRQLVAGWVPPGVELMVLAHAHCYVTTGARRRARLGAIGYHPSLLPRHRGRDAVRWAIHMRESVTGGTVYWLTDRADAGPIIAQDWCHIRPEDDPTSLWRRELGPMGVRLLSEAVAAVVAGKAAGVPQNEAMATWEPAFERLPLRTG